MKRNAEYVLGLVGGILGMGAANFLTHFGQGGSVTSGFYWSALVASVSRFYAVPGLLLLVAGLMALLRKDKTDANR